jgi:hypothetical protein
VAALGLFTQTRGGIEREERACARLLDAAHRDPRIPIVIDSPERALTMGELAGEVSGLLAAGALAVGVLEPITMPTTDAAERLAVALRGTHRVAVMARVDGDHVTLPDGRLAARVALGFRELDRPRSGPLEMRLTAHIGGVPLQSMAAATLLALRDRGETEIQPYLLGRLPHDLATQVATVRTGQWHGSDVAGHCVLVAAHAADAAPTAAALRALLRVPTLPAVGIVTLLLCVVLAVVGAFSALAMRPLAAIAVACGAAVFALAVAVWRAAAGIPPLVCAPIVALGTAQLLTFAQQLGSRGAGRLRAHLSLRTQASPELAIDLQAARGALTPAWRPVCVLVVDLEMAEVPRAARERAHVLEAHERRVHDVVTRLGGIVDVLATPRVVALFGALPTASVEAPDDERVALLAVRAASELAEGTTIHAGIAAGTALCGQFGLDGRYRVTGGPVDQAIAAAGAAAAASVAVVGSAHFALGLEPHVLAHPLAAEWVALKRIS